MFDLSTAHGQISHYAAVRARLDGLPVPRQVTVRPVRLVVPPLALEPAVVVAADEPRRMPSPYGGLIDAVCQRHCVRPEEVTSHSQAARFSAARHELFWRLHNDAGLSLREVGQLLGFDHSSVRRGADKHAERMGQA